MDPTISKLIDVKLVENADSAAKGHQVITEAMRFVAAGHMGGAAIAADILNQRSASVQPQPGVATLK